MIKPTVGRVVWFRPMSASENPQPLAAIIAFVHDDKTVNLAVFDRNGESYPLEGVQLIQEGEMPCRPGGYCEWMPYQKGQAAKVDQLEAAIKDGFTKP